MDVDIKLRKLRKLPNLDNQAMGLITDLQALWADMTPAEKGAVIRHLEGITSDDQGWPLVYVNRDSGRLYNPHTRAEDIALISDTPRYLLVKGGEGGGKSVFGIIKDLERLRLGLDGVLISPNFPHFRRSLWPEFRRWCPWDQVVEPHQRYGKQHWHPREPFDVVFKNGATLHCSGIENPGSLEGPNLNFAHVDEARHIKDDSAIKVLDGRIRIPGKTGTPPQMWLTTTPRMNWLYEYFGPLKCVCATHGEIGIEFAVYDKVITGINEAMLDLDALRCPICHERIVEVVDEHRAFKYDAAVIMLLSKDNEGNIMEGYSDSRAQSLTEAERRVYLEAAWEDTEAGQPFLPTMVWWDNSEEEVAPLKPWEPIVVSMDAATGSDYSDSDCFSVVAVSRHPDESRADREVQVRIARTWQAGTGQKIDFWGTREYPGPIRFLCQLCGWEADDKGSVLWPSGGGFNVIAVCYDPNELQSEVARLQREGVSWFREFPQQSLRLESDRFLLNMIQQGRISHGPDKQLRDHLQYADRKVDLQNRIRIVKRTNLRKIDLAVCLSMGTYMVMNDLNL